jgi:hypothetical protein
MVQQIQITTDYLLRCITFEDPLTHLSSHNHSTSEDPQSKSCNSKSLRRSWAPGRDERKGVYDVAYDECDHVLLYLAAELGFGHCIKRIRASNAIGGQDAGLA